MDFRVIDSKPGPLAKGKLSLSLSLFLLLTRCVDEIHRLTFKPLDPMDRYTKGSKWRVPLWLLSPDDHRILHVYSKKSAEQSFRRTNWQLMAVIMRGDRPVAEPDVSKVRVESGTK